MQRQVLRCQLGSPDRQMQREQSSVSAVPEDSKQQQIVPVTRAKGLGAIIRNAAKATAVAALILAMVRNTLTVMSNIPASYAWPLKVLRIRRLIV